MAIDELDELLFNFGIGFEMGGRRKLIDKTKQEILALIEKRLPKEKELLVNDTDFEEYPNVNGARKLGFNEAISEIKQRMGI